jgi:rhodanese-related sulfurtransferase
MRKKVLLSFLLQGGLFANEMGCNAFEKEHPIGCSVDESAILFKTHKEDTQFIKISPTLTSVELSYHDENISIERLSINSLKSCPPFCIQPITIKGVKTVGELETLTFIKNFKKNKTQLLIDARSNRDFKENTIAGAINLPLMMLEDESAYQEEVLKLLGAKKRTHKKIANQWFFKNAFSLLIFGESATTNEASTMIQKLLKLGYPASKILYYRGGITSWKAMGLTLY